MEKGEITLMTLGGGVAQELFAREMAKVLASVADPNTEPDAAREITLKVRFKPSKDRDSMAIGIVASASVPPYKGFSTLGFIGKDLTGRMVVVEHNPKQAQFNFVPEGVTGINQLKKGGANA